MDGHSLVKMAHMVYGVDPSFVDGEGQLGKAVWEFGLFNSARKR